MKLYERVIIDLNDLKSIKLGERKKTRLENKNYNLVKNSQGFNKIEMIYKKGEKMKVIIETSTGATVTNLKEAVKNKNKILAKGKVRCIDYICNNQEQFGYEGNGRINNAILAVIL